MNQLLVETRKFPETLLIQDADDLAGLIKWWCITRSLCYKRANKSRTNNWC
jgi:hypothetical protein